MSAPASCTTETYFEFPNEIAAGSALRIIQQHICTQECKFGAFRTVMNAAHNCNPAVLKITLFPHTGDMRALATELGALRVTQNFQALWEQHKSSRAA